MKRPPPVTADELAERLGIDRETLYRQRERMEREDGLPRPLNSRGHYRWDRASIDAWFGRHHPALAGVKIANQDIAPLAPNSADDTEGWREFFNRAYPRRQ